MKYTHGFCSAVEGYGRDGYSIYVDREQLGLRPLPYLEIEMEETYEELISEESSWSPGCDHALRQLICHTTLPFCSKSF